jgi:1-acyl-sn-glycerol-3-phosphate acyltransferase
MTSRFRTSPLRFIFRAIRGCGMFLDASLEAIWYTRGHPHDMSVSYRYTQRLAEGFKRIYGMKYVIRNEERLLTSQPCVYLANHRSNLDVLTLAPIFRPRTIAIGKQSVARIPFFGKVWARSRNIVIDRTDRDDSRAGISAAERAIVEDRLSVFMFPEGTRNHGAMRPFKKGAFHLARNAGVLLQPLVCAVPRGWFVGRRLFVQKSTEIRIDVLDPIDPTRFSTVDEVLAFAQSEMREALTRLEAEVEGSPS